MTSQREMDHLIDLLELDKTEVVEFNIEQPGQVTVVLRRTWQSSDIPAAACEILGIPHRPSLALVKKRAEAIITKDNSDTDPEGAHADQDALFVDVLRCVAEDHPDAAAMVNEALRVPSVGGTRWYA